MADRHTRPVADIPEFEQGFWFVGRHAPTIGEVAKYGQRITQADPD